MAKRIGPPSLAASPKASVAGRTNPPPSVLATNQGDRIPGETYPRTVRDAAEAQIALARLGISCGSVDGRLGPQTAQALAAFQRMNHLPETGLLDPAMRERLLLGRPPLAKYVLSAADLASLQPLSDTWAGKAQQTNLQYESVLELVAEKSRSHPEFLRQLNPPAIFAAPVAGMTIQVPDTEIADPAPCAFIRIFLARRVLEAFDARSNLLAHFPCSIAQRAEKRPAGELHVCSIAPHPNYTFDPELFPESEEARTLDHKLVLPPGPNNPVGVAWIGLDQPGYGIHGTPVPEQVGRTESHGCFRLANWNAEHLLKMVRLGTPVYVE